MSVNTILVALNEVDRADQLIRVSSTLALRHDAHLIGMFVIPAAEVYPAVGMELSTQVYAGHRQFYLDHSKQVKARFEHALDANGLQGEWRMTDIKSSLVADGVLHHAHQVGLIVVPQKQENSSAGIETDFTERLIMESGRPVLIVPAFGEFEKIGKNVLVGWNGTKESARAVFDSLPLMVDAENITVSWVNAEDDLEDDEVLPGAELAATLARHGLPVTTQALPGGDLPVAETLLNEASDSGADLLIMGAYGHSRIREFVFGGATRTILESMTVPVLMSH